MKIYCSVPFVVFVVVECQKYSTLINLEPLIAIEDQLLKDIKIYMRHEKRRIGEIKR